MYTVGRLPKLLLNYRRRAIFMKLTILGSLDPEETWYLIDDNGDRLLFGEDRILIK